MANGKFYWVTFTSEGVNVDTKAYKVSLYEEISDEIEDSGDLELGEETGVYHAYVGEHHVAQFYYTKWVRSLSDVDIKDAFKDIVSSYPQIDWNDPLDDYNEIWFTIEGSEERFYGGQFKNGLKYHR